MENTIFVGLSRQIALQKQMDLIATNIANMNTPGFRAQNMVFTEYLEQPSLRPQPDHPRDPLSMVLDYGQYQSTAPGSIQRTGNPLHVALEGKGWLGVVTPDGVQYTRAGLFQRTVDGTIVTSTGLPVANPGGGPITIPSDAKQIIIGRNGAINTENGTIGRLMVVEFENDQNLEAMGNGLYRTDAAAVPATETAVVQNAVEGSNVQPVLEMTRMIDVLRAYQSTQRMLNDEHDRQRTMIRVLTETEG